MSCTSCWSLCVCVKRVISAGEVFCHELPFSAYFLQEKDLGLEPLQSCWDEAQDHSTFFILSGTCDREVLLHAQPILDNLGHFWRNLFFCYEDTWLTVLAPNCDKTSPFLTLEGCGICLPCLSGCYWPAWIGHAGLQSHERWKKLLSSLNVQLRLHILIVPLPKIQPTFLLEEPWQQLALLAGLSSSLVAAMYWSKIQHRKNKLHNIFICCNENDMISGTFSVSWIKSVTANGKKSANSRCLCFELINFLPQSCCLGQTHPVHSFVSYLFISGEMWIWCGTKWCSAI